MRFGFIEHLNNLMDGQSQQFQAIEKAYGMDNIGEKYIFSMIGPLHDLLHVIIRKSCPFIDVKGSVKSIRVLMRLEWLMRGGNMKSAGNCKKFIDLLMDAGVLGEGEMEVSEKPKIEKDGKTKQKRIKTTNQF